MSKFVSGETRKLFFHNPAFENEGRIRQVGINTTVFTWRLIFHPIIIETIALVASAGRATAGHLPPFAVSIVKQWQ